MNLQDVERFSNELRTVLVELEKTRIAIFGELLWGRWPDPKDLELADALVKWYNGYKAKEQEHDTRDQADESRAHDSAYHGEAPGDGRVSPSTAEDRRDEGSLP